MLKQLSELLNSRKLRVPILGMLVHSTTIKVHYNKNKNFQLSNYVKLTLFIIKFYS